MKNTSDLSASLNRYLGWNKARVDCFMQMLLGLFAVKTVNLQEIALTLNGQAKVESNYRRLQRFFALFHIDFVQIARWIFKLYVSPGQKFYVVIDRTNWYWGKQKINVFMLGIAHEGMAIPLFWHMLPKAGSSNFKEQRRLIKQFISTFGVVNIQGLLADREFASGKFFQWLDKKTIPFYIRIKEGTMTQIRKKKFLTAKKIFNDLQPKTKKEFHMTLSVLGQKVFLAGSRSERGELMIVATNCNPRNAIASYLRRWEIESLFQGLKGRGFLFEMTHMTQIDRIAKLTALLAIGFVWAHKVGEFKAHIKPIIWKQFRNQKRPQYSYFRYGLDEVRNAIFHSYYKFNQLKQYVSLLLPLQEAVS
jgi:DDE family transposase